MRAISISVSNRFVGVLTADGSVFAYRLPGWTEWYKVPIPQPCHLICATTRDLWMACGDRVLSWAEHECVGPPQDEGRSTGRLIVALAALPDDCLILTNEGLLGTTRQSHLCDLHVKDPVFGWNLVSCFLGDRIVYVVSSSKGLAAVYANGTIVHADFDTERQI
jgi:hypothetical protein